MIFLTGVILSIFAYSNAVKGGEVSMKDSEAKKGTGRNATRGHVCLRLKERAWRMYAH